MQSPSPHRRHRERESHLCKSVRKIFFVLEDCCNCVAVWERQSFRLFNFFCRVQVSPRCIGMKITLVSLSSFHLLHFSLCRPLSLSLSSVLQNINYARIYMLNLLLCCVVMTLSLCLSFQFSVSYSLLVRDSYFIFSFGNLVEGSKL